MKKVLTLACVAALCVFCLSACDMDGTAPSSSPSHTVSPSPIAPGTQKPDATKSPSVSPDAPTKNPEASPSAT
ncbi:hypothetical protein LJC32_04755 [Oscillospiraceae bacterium OttesenSCG-928-F05]|nr:hypothetical protein [Oscillospiraceae bacterium OttesenSCG-928-F05]